MDKYLIEENVYKRLEAEYLKYGSIIVAYDFDGTVHDFHSEGITFEYVSELLRRCERLKIARFIVFTAREEKDYPYIWDFLKEKNLPANSINVDLIEQFRTKDVNKVYYNILLDDRAGLLSAYNTLDRLARNVEEGKLKRV